MSSYKGKGIIQREGYHVATYTNVTMMTSRTSRRHIKRPPMMPPKIAPLASLEPWAADDVCKDIITLEHVCILNYGLLEVSVSLISKVFS